MEGGTININLKEVAPKDTVKFLSGKKRGLAAREHFHLDEIESDEVKYILTIPDYLTGISSSFTNGLLGGLVDKSGGLSDFLKTIQFDGKLLIVTDILTALERGYSNKFNLE